MITVQLNVALNPTLSMANKKMGQFCSLAIVKNGKFAVYVPTCQYKQFRIAEAVFVMYHNVMFTEVFMIIM